MFFNGLLLFLPGVFISLGGAACPDDNHYWETDINRDCGQVENGAKFQQVGAMQWGERDANGNLPYNYNTKICLTKTPGCDCIRLSSAEDHKVNRFYLATGFFIAIFRYELRYLGTLMGFVLMNRQRRQLQKRQGDGRGPEWFAVRGVQDPQLHGLETLIEFDVSIAKQTFERALESYSTRS
ncbi:hypothetical protein PSPO01_07412 [Paraphaeosphaeria sporulosa]